MSPCRAAVVLYLVLAVTRCRATLKWDFTNNSAALCNDFTRAGFFHRSPSDAEQKWVVYLEGGSLCNSNETCNRRYFRSSLRDRYSTDGSFLTRMEFGNFDTALAWAETGAAGQPLAQVVNPQITSTYCFRNETQFFDSNELSIEGRDVLSSDCDENPAFCDHGHVLVPYCSSDLWLGSEDTSSRQPSSLLGEEPCNCWDQDCFQYNPTSEDLQFTFRGQTIFRSVLETLDRMYDLQRASEIVLVGSSAGGVGAVNSAKWVRETFQSVRIKVILDSSWFINFQDALLQQFESTDLLLILESNQACTDLRYGYPCCLTPRCILQESNQLTGEPYYPRGVPLFAVTGLYDIFVLSNALSRIDTLDDSGLTTSRQALDLIAIVGEYGGVMNTTLMEVSIAASSTGVQFSHYSTNCFHHRYLSPSSILEEGGLYGSEAVQYSLDVISFT